MKKVSKKIIAVTGSSGALGNEFIKLYKKKYKFIFYKKKIENKTDFFNWLKKNTNIEIFLHFAAISTISSSKRDLKKTYLVNSDATIKILNTLNKFHLIKLKYFLFASSSHVYKPSFKELSENSKRTPSNIYGKSKKIVEDFIIKNRKKIKFKIGIARIFNFYSPKHKKGFFIYDIKNKLIQKNKKIHFNKINTIRDYININQLCEILNFMINKNIVLPVNIGSSRPLNLTNLAKKIIKRKKNKKLITFDKTQYPGLLSNINLLRKLGYKKRIIKFRI